MEQVKLSELKSEIKKRADKWNTFGKVAQEAVSNYKGS